MIPPVQTDARRFQSEARVAASHPRRSGLSREEERRLAVRIAAGDRQARDALVQANLGLVVRVARGYQGRGLSLDDLVGEGNLGLIRAAEAFIPRFSTYATYWIKDAILAALYSTTATIRVPGYMVRLLSKWRRA
jgi:RNA polymerase primary sigma factor